MTNYPSPAQHSGLADSAHRSPPGPVDPDLAAIVKEIKNQASASVAVGAFGILFFGIILGPFAMYRGSKACRLMRETDLGWEYKSRAKLGRELGFVAVSLWGLWILLNVVIAMVRK
jgi:hypothetical protein